MDEEKMSTLCDKKEEVKYPPDSEFGGRNVHETVFRCLRAVLASNVARLYNFKGAKVKKKFEDLRLSLTVTNVLYRCQHMNAATLSSSRKDLELSITKWLSESQVQDGGWKSRDGQNKNG